MSVEKLMARLGRFMVPRMNFAAAPYGVSGPCCLDSQFGKLDGDLVSGSTATVSVWTDGVDSGDNIESVKLPPWVTSGKLPSGDWVTIEKIDGDWYVRLTSNTHRHEYVMMYESISPYGSGKALKAYWDASEDKLMPSVKYMANLKTTSGVYTAPLQAANLWGTYVSSNDVFSPSDIGTYLTVTGDANWTKGDYLITQVSTITYLDLVIDAADNTKVSSPTRQFLTTEEGFELKVTGGTGFTTGLLTISSVDANGVATLSGSAGTCGSTGGCAAITPYATLDSYPAAAGVGSGTGFVGAIEVYETQGIYRAWGIEDLGDAVHHLNIHATDNTKITNEGTAFGSDDGKTLIIEGGTGFTTGIYHVIDASSGVLTLDRSCGTVGSTLGYGEILRTDPGLGIVEYKSDSSHWELVTLQCIAKTALATVVGDYDSGDDEILVKDFRSMDIGQNALPDGIVASYTNLCVPEGESDEVYNDDTDLVFTSNDVGLTLEITSTDTRLIPGDYEITAVDGSGNATLDRDCVEIAYDLVITDADDEKVTSATLGFDADDDDMHLTITAGTGFTAATYDITDVTSSVATLDADAGDVESTGGTGYLSGEFDGNGKTYKVLEVHNNYTLNSGDEVELLWDEYHDDGPFYRVYKDTGNGDKYRQCKCQLTADMASTDAVCCVDNITATHGESPGTALGGVKNEFGFEGDDNQWCLIEKWPNQNYWVVFPIC